MGNPIVQILSQMIYIQAQSSPGKPWYKSKRFWTFALSLTALLLQTKTRLGWVIDPGTQLGLLTGINFIVGLLTKSPTGFAWEPDQTGPQAGPG
jgi:hypothetical protein